MNRRVVKPEEQKHYQRSLSAFFRLVGFAQAARPLAGGSPLAVIGRNQSLQNALAFVAFRKTGRMNRSTVFLEAHARSTLQPLPSGANAQQPKVRPNPSIEPTSTGWARYARCSLSASRAQPLPAAHVKR
jgi:hypothetical protein